MRVCLLTLEERWGLVDLLERIGFVTRTGSDLTWRHENIRKIGCANGPDHSQRSRNDSPTLGSSSPPVELWVPPQRPHDWTGHGRNIRLRCFSFDAQNRFFRISPSGSGAQKTPPVRSTSSLRESLHVVSTTSLHTSPNPGFEQVWARVDPRRTRLQALEGRHSQ